MEMKNEGNEERSKGGPWDIMRKTMKIRNESIMVVGTLRVIVRDESVMVSQLYMRAYMVSKNIREVYIWEHYVGR